MFDLNLPRKDHILLSIALPNIDIFGEAMDKSNTLSFLWLTESRCTVAFLGVPN